MSDKSNDSTSTGVSRRQFLKSSALSSLALGPLILGGCSPEEQHQDRGEANNIIFMVSDGMSSGTLSMAHLLKKRQFGTKTHWIDL